MINPRAITKSKLENVVRIINVINMLLQKILFNAKQSSKEGIKEQIRHRQQKVKCHTEFQIY